MWSVVFACFVLAQVPAASGKMEVCSMNAEVAGLDQIGAAGDMAKSASGLKYLKNNRKWWGEIAGGTYNDPFIKLAKGEKIDYVEYAKTIAPFDAPAAAGLLLFILFACPCCCARCYCCKCLSCIGCGPEKCCRPKSLRDHSDEEIAVGYNDDYSFCYQMFIAVGYVLMACACLGIVVVGMLAVTNITNGVKDTVCTLDSMVDDTIDFGEKLLKPVLKISNMSLGLLNKVNDTMHSTSSIGNGLNTITAQLKQYSTKIKAVSITDYPLALTATVGGQIDGITDQMDDKAGSMISNIENLRSGVDTKLVAAKGMVVKLANQAKGSNENMVNMIKDKVRVQANQLESPLEQSQEYSGYAGYAVYSLGLISIVFGLLGALLMIPFRLKKVGLCCTTLSWSTGCCGMFFFFLLASIFLPFSIVFYDVCQVLDDVPTDVGAYTKQFGMRRLDEVGHSMGEGRKLMGKIDAAGILEGCFNNVSIMESLNMSASFNFRDAIDFKVLDGLNVTETMDFSQLNNFSGQINDLEPASFGLNEADRQIYEQCCNGGDDAPNTIGGQTVKVEGNQVYCTQNVGAVPRGQKVCVDCNSVDDATCAAKVGKAACHSDGGSVGIVCRVSKQMNNASSVINSTLLWMKSDMNDISTSLSDFEGTVKRLTDKLGEVEGDTEPLFNEVDNLQTAGDCTFVATTYNNLKSSLCETMLDGLLNTGLCTCACGFFLMFMFLFMVQIEKVFFYNELDEDDEYLIDDQGSDGIEMGKQGNGAVQYEWKNQSGAPTQNPLRNSNGMSPI